MSGKLYAVKSSKTDIIYPVEILVTEGFSKPTKFQADSIFTIGKEELGEKIDVCVLCRPFDNQQYLRIRLETESVNLILANVKKGKYKLLVSPVHMKEIKTIPDIYERIQLKTILDKFGVHTAVNISKTRERAEELVSIGFGVADAAHIAFAEKSGTPFISCDDRLIKKCLNHKVKIWCGSPVIFCEKEGLK